MNIDAEFTLVMVEDDDGHARLIEKNLRRAGIDNPIVHLQDGRQAIHYFLEAEHPPKPQKVLILLDLNLPIIDGCEVLKRLKNDERTKSIPVIMLTTTDNPKEIDHCYALGCNIYMTKPVEYDRFSEAIHILGMMLAVVKIPYGLN